MQVAGRVVSGALVGAAIGVAAASVWLGIFLGVVGSLIGTYAGSYLRARLAGFFGKDLPAALLEDAAAILIAVVAVTRLR